MGCFNVTCGISHLCIGWMDPVVYFPLVPNQYREYQIGDGNNQLIGCECFYSPATLPIFGQYNDYGSLEDIEQDDNVKFLQEKLDCPISDFFDLYHRRPHGELHPKIAEITSGMFVHREIYDLLITNLVGEFGKKEVIRTQLEEEYDRFRSELDTSLQRARDWGLEPSVFNLELYVHSNTFQLQRQSFLKDVYSNCFYTDRFRQQFIDLFVFENTMYSVNAFFFPTMNGCQGGNPYVSKILYKKSLDIVNKEIKERKS